MVSEVGQAFLLRNWQDGILAVAGCVGCMIPPSSPRFTYQNAILRKIMVNQGPAGFLTAFRISPVEVRDDSVKDNRTSTGLIREGCHTRTLAQLEKITKPNGMNSLFSRDRTNL